VESFPVTCTPHHHQLASEREDCLFQPIYSVVQLSQHAIVVNMPPSLMSQCLTNVALIKLLARVKEALGSNPDSRVVSSRLSSVPDLEDECIPFWILYGMSVDIFCFFVNRFSYTILICFSSLPCFVL
jgi:hypothetical protein